MSDPRTDEAAHRERLVSRALGLFLTVLALLLPFGLPSAEKPIDRALLIGAALTLLLVAVLFLFRGRRRRGAEDR